MAARSMAARTSPPATAVVERFYQFSLLGMLASGYFALAGALDLPTAIAMLAALAARALMASGVVRLNLSGRIATALGLLCMGFYPLDQRYVSGSFVIATAHLVCFLAVIKILWAKTRRDFAWVRVIAMLELMAGAMVSASPSFFAFLALFLLCSVAAFASGEILRSMQPAAVEGVENPEPHRVSRAALRGFPRRLTLLSSALFTGILVLTTGMFFVLPRTARAALQHIVPQRYHIPGFANEVSLGEIGEIQQHSTPVMHVRSYSLAPLPALHWRGASLSHFDGTRWYNRSTPDEWLPVDRGIAKLEATGSARTGQSLQYEVQLTGISPDTLFFAGVPETVSVNLPLLRRSAGGSVKVPRLPVAGLRYGVHAFLEDEQAPVTTAPLPLADDARREFLELPRIDRRIVRLAREMTAGAATQEEEARAIERHLRQDYSYTLELPSSPPADPLANFLFVRRKGHCEYFASAMAVMLRTMGIPSRVATGFLGGVYNPMTGWQVLRASDAHSWVEAWIDGRGWTTFDPTPAAPAEAGSGLLSGLNLLIDAAGQFWQDWVLSYDIERQVVLASRLEQSSRRFRTDWFDGWAERLDRAAGAISSHATLVGALLLAGALLAIYGRSLAHWLARLARIRRARRGAAARSDATLLYERMLAVLEKRGIRKPPWVTPLEFSKMLPAPELASRVARLTEAYNQWRFGGQRDAAARMVDLLEQIERQ
jgi:transglutaminase-like putative cysteine protease